jgi:hypothetical protein
LTGLFHGIVNGCPHQFWIFGPMNEVCVSANYVGVEPVRNRYRAVGIFGICWKADTQESVLLVQRHVNFPINPAPLPGLCPTEDYRDGTAGDVLLTDNLLMVIHVVAADPPVNVGGDNLRTL